MKAFKPHPGGTALQFFAGAFICFVGLTTDALILGVGFVFIVVGFMRTSWSVFTCEEEYLEVKQAPLRSSEFIKYADMQKLEVINKNKACLYYTNEGESTQTELIIGVCNANDKQEFISELENKGVLVTQIENLDK